MAVPIPGGLCLSSCRRAAGACAVPCRASAASSAHAINGATKQFNFMSDTGRSLLPFDPTPRCSRRASVERFPTRIHVVPTSQTGDSPPPVQDQAVKLLVFDWDGTVVDSIAHITDSWTRAFEDWVAARQEERLQAGLSPCFVPPAEEVKKCIGLSVDATILHHIKDPTDEDIDAVREAYRKYFRAGMPCPPPPPPLPPPKHPAIPPSMPGLAGVSTEVSTEVRGRYRGQYRCQLLRCRTLQCWPTSPFPFLVSSPHTSPPLLSAVPIPSLLSFHPSQNARHPLSRRLAKQPCHISSSAGNLPAYRVPVVNER